MSIFTVSSRYAKSLIDLAKEQGNLDLIKTDIDQVIAVLRANPELQAVLKNPIIRVDKKRKIVAEIFEGKINPTIIAFFGILVSKGRGGILYDIAKEFVREYNEVNGIVKATVTSAIALSSARLLELQQSIAQQINAQVILTNLTDASLIGGYIVKVGDRQIDVSIARKLNKLEKYLINQGV